MKVLKFDTVRPWYLYPNPWRMPNSAQAPFEALPLPCGLTSLTGNPQRDAASDIERLGAPHQLGPRRMPSDTRGVSRLASSAYHWMMKGVP